MSTVLWLLLAILPVFVAATAKSESSVNIFLMSVNFVVNLSSFYS